MMKYLPLLLCLSLISCGKKPNFSIPPPPVKVAKVEVADVPVYIDNIGHMEEFVQVHIQSQVTGQLMTHHIKDGQYIKKGDLLFTVDKRPFVADVEKAEAVLIQAIAAFNYAQENARRNAPLVKEDYISQDAYDNLVKQVDIEKAKVDQARAELETAKINLEYCTIYSPVNGQGGTVIVDDGNILFASDNQDLVVINQIEPIYAGFFLPEKYLDDVRAHQALGDLKVLFWPEGLEDTPFEAKLTFINNEIDLSTGMIKMKAIHPNKERLLWNGQYIRVRVILDTLKNAHLVPESAVEISQKGHYVYVLQSDDTVELRYVKVGQRENGNLVILEGLSENETVILEGQINLLPGMKVRVVQQTEKA